MTCRHSVPSISAQSYTIRKIILIFAFPQRHLPSRQGGGEYYNVRRAYRLNCRVTIFHPIRCELRAPDCTAGPFMPWRNRMTLAQ